MSELVLDKEILILYYSIAMKKREGELVVRLKKVKGQLEGVIKMYQEKRSCDELLQQMRAARAGLDQAIVCLFREDVCRHLSPQKKDRVVKTVEKILKIK